MNYSRAASLVVATAYTVAAVWIVGPDAQRLITCMAAILLPLPFIWFPEELGSYTSRGEVGLVQRPTPAVLLAVAGWIVLVAVPPALIALNRVR